MARMPCGPVSVWRKRSEALRKNHGLDVKRPSRVPPWAAGICSLIVPGLGQALARSVWRGVLVLGIIRGDHGHAYLEGGRPRPSADDRRRETRQGIRIAAGIHRGAYRLGPAHLDLECTGTRVSRQRIGAADSSCSR